MPVSREARRQVLTACACMTILIVLSSVLSGCIEIGAEEERTSFYSASPEMFDPVVPYPAPLPVPTTSLCTGAFTSADQPCNTTGGSVSPADPIPARDVVTPAYRTLLPDASDSRPPRHYVVDEFFRESYPLSGNSIGLLANASEPPLTILFEVEPGCGNPNLCFFVLTVRDPGTLEVVAEEGYGRTYSSDPAKHLVVRSSGPQHLTLFGRGVTVTISLLSGAGSNQTQIMPFVTPTSAPEEDIIWF